ncbi:MAG: hypothetical protein JRJ85_05845 [Deltaproteobacteria bacterium]|nr:hypothetical protein [Deltaproteobacteria bacterium]
MKAIPGNYRCYGYFSPDRQEIGLATEEETVFFHEMAHAAHERPVGDFKKVLVWKKEIVAELVAAALCRMVGKTSKYLGNNHQYIRHYAEKEGLSPLKACLRGISDVEKVLNLILGDEMDDASNRDGSGS